MQRHRFRFENLEAWQLARSYNSSIYAATRSFPKEELFALTSQVRRASVSVSSNTSAVEGTVVELLVISGKRWRGSRETADLTGRNTVLWLHL